MSRLLLKLWLRKPRSVAISNDKEAMADPATDPASLKRVLAAMKNASTLSELEEVRRRAWKKGSRFRTFKKSWWHDS